MVEAQNTGTLELCMKESWYKELGTFLMVPFLSTVACYFIPLFRSEEGMNFMVLLPLTSAFSYGHLLSPRKRYYENGWKEKMGYDSFIFANVKRTLLFAAPSGLSAWTISLFFEGYLKELSLFFEVAVWGISAGVLLHATISYIEEVRKLKKFHQDQYKESVRNLFGWLISPTVVSFSLLIGKSLILFALFKGRPWGI